MSLNAGMQLAQMEREVQGRLAAEGVRYTKGRQSVVRALSRVPGPLSASELHRRLRSSVPLSSLYRTLTVLEDAGVLTPHHGMGGITRFELAEWLTGHHHHLVCNECWSVEDIELEDEREQRLSDLASQVADGAGFLATGHTLEIEGLCRECSA